MEVSHMTTLLSTPTKVVGVTKENENGDNIQEILEEMSLEWEDYKKILSFSREPDNPYDENAIAVYAGYFDGFPHIGYINADLASRLSPQIDSGCELRGYITEITGGGSKKYGCNIEIQLIEKTEEEIAEDLERSKRIKEEIKQKQKEYAEELDRKKAEEQQIREEYLRLKQRQGNIFGFFVLATFFSVVLTFINSAFFPLTVISAIITIISAIRYKM